MLDHAKDLVRIEVVLLSLAAPRGYEGFIRI